MHYIINNIPFTRSSLTVHVSRALIAFILQSQDVDNGGISDRPGDMVDVWHTCFGITGLSLLGYEGMEAVDAVYCMPKKVTQRVFGR